MPVRGCQIALRPGDCKSLQRLRSPPAWAGRLFGEIRAIRGKKITPDSNVAPGGRSGGAPGVSASGFPTTAS